MGFPKRGRPFVTEGVLVETFEEGTALTELLEGGAESLDPNKLVDGVTVKKARDQIGQLCMSTFIQMVFQDNFVHADMHPGNILFRYPKPQDPESYGFISKLLPSKKETKPPPEIVVLDTGLTVKLNRNDRRNFVELFHAISMYDGTRCGELMLHRSPGDPAQVRDPEGFISGVNTLVTQVSHGGLQLGNHKVGDLLGSLLNLSCTHRVKLETSFVTMVVGIMVLEGVGRQLEPSLD